MKKNVFFIVLDSFIYDKIGVQEYGPTTTPFLDSIKKDCITTTNLYSQGPFTESAIMALLSGNDSLNEGGYMHNLNTKKDHFIDVFHKNNYEIFNIFYPYFMYSKETLSKIDNPYFNRDFIYDSVFSNRLSYFRDISKIRYLDRSEIEDIEKQLEITFDAWENYLSKGKCNISHQLLKNALKNYNFSANMTKLLDEQKKYYANKKEYIKILLDEGRNHALYKIDRLNSADLTNKNVIKEFYKKNKVFLLKILWMQFFYTIKNNRISLKKLIKSIHSLVRTRTLAGYLKSVIFTLFVGQFAYRYKKHNFLKEMPSFRSQIDFMIGELSKRESHDKPFFAMIHPLDLHNRTSFITYDSDCIERLDEEINVFKKYVSQINSKFKGSIIYDLSVVYVDFCLKKIFKKLQFHNLLDNTLVVITADHGCSYVNSPIRDIFVNNYHTENYKIPLYIYAKDLKSQELNSYLTNRDVLPTVYELLNIDKPANIVGKSMLTEDTECSYVISEYMGGGCPDMRLRPVHFIIRDNKYLVALTVYLHEDFSSKKLIEVFNLTSDPEELKNLLDNPSCNCIKDIDYLVAKVRNRFDELKKHYELFNK